MNGLRYDIDDLASGAGQAIANLLPEIAARAAETEEARRLPADLAQKLA